MAQYLHCLGVLHAANPDPDFETLLHEKIEIQSLIEKQIKKSNEITLKTILKLLENTNNFAQNLRPELHFQQSNQIKKSKKITLKRV